MLQGIFITSRVPSVENLMSNSSKKANQVLSLFISDVAFAAKRGADESTTSVVREILLKGLGYSAALAKEAYAAQQEPSCPLRAAILDEAIRRTQQSRDALWGYETTPAYARLLPSSPP
jgi:hypothetical protein